VTTSLRILHVSTPLSWRGGEQQLLYLWKGLDALGVAQQILVPTSASSAQRFRDAGAKVIEVSKAGPWDLRFSAAIALQSKRFDPDFIHVHDSQAHTFAFLAQKITGLKVPLVIHRRVDFVVGDNIFSKRKYNDRGCAAVICVSRLVQQMMEQTLEEPSKCRLIYDGIDPERFDLSKPAHLRAEFGISSNKKLVGNVAALTQQKDYFTFIDVAAHLKNVEPDIHFMIFGTGHQQLELEAYARQKQVWDRVTFAGFRDDVGAVLKGLDLLLFTSETEGLGTTILDAFSVELPVVATNAGGIPEIAKHRHNAWVSEVKDVEGLSEGVLVLLFNPELRHTFARAGMETAKAFTYRQMALKTKELYTLLKNNLHAH
jgi:glycosyltransferase involved in cell wall biosynthesis